MTRLLRSAQLGAATGLRSMAAPSQLSRHLAGASPSHSAGPVTELLGRATVRSLLQIAALGEMVADKLPFVPNRIESGPLLGRAFFGGVAGGVFARVRGESPALGALLGGAGAVVGAYAGYHARRALVHQAGLPDMPVALCEDSVAIVMARAALRG
jgi:uncharacterized membrane protein